VSTAPTLPDGLIRLRVKRVSYEAERINSYELVKPDGGMLPPFSAGAHIDIHLPDGMIRSYSLVNDQSERHRYVIAVNNDPASRGGQHGERLFAGAHRVPDLIDPHLRRWPGSGRRPRGRSAGSRGRPRGQAQAQPERQRGPGRHRTRHLPSPGHVHPRTLLQPVGQKPHAWA